MFVLMDYKLSLLCPFISLFCSVNSLKCLSPDFTYKLIDQLYRIDRLIYIIKVYMILSIWLSFSVTDEYSLKLKSLYTVYRRPIYNNRSTYFSALQGYLLPLGIVKLCTVPRPFIYSLIIPTYIIEVLGISGLF